MTLAQCPVCQSELEITSQHHGTLYTCPKCGAVFFVDWEGKPEVASDERTLSDESPSPLEGFTVSEEVTATQDEASYDFAQPSDPDSFDLSEIADFGNSDLGHAAFSYTLTVSGIDSVAVREQIREALEDAKFGWNVIQLMAQIKGGVLTLRSVNAVKASILIQRVKYLPVKISWRQDVLSSTV